MKPSKVFIIILVLLGLILVSRFLLLAQKNVFLISDLSFLSSKDFTLLLLGKPGPGYIGSENTDSIIVLHYQSKNNTIFLIPIPRDLIVRDGIGNLEKINALYEKGKVNLLLTKASEFTGLKVKNYLAVDLKLILDLVDFVGGIEVNLDEPVTDAVTLYTLPAGRQKLNGYLTELVIRSRYHREGDFFRMKNQMKIITALKDKILDLNPEQKLALMKFLNQRKYYWETNLSKNDLLSLSLNISESKNLRIVPLVLHWPNSFLVSGSFDIYNSHNVYGIYPKEGIDNYEKIKFYFRSQLSQS